MSTPPPPPPGTFAGWVELADGVPASGATVTVHGTPVKATCDKDGCFATGGVPAGNWKVSVSHPLAAAPMHLMLGSMRGVMTTVGLIRLNARGSISGRVLFLDPDHYARALVAVPALGIVTQPNLRGGYLLQGVAAGQREVVLIHPLYASPPKRVVQVAALANVVAADFVRRPPAAESALVDFGTAFKGTQSSAVWHLWNPDGVSAAVDQVQITGPHAARFTLGRPRLRPLTVPATGLEIPLSLDTSIEGAFTAELRVQGTAETVAFAETVALKATVAPPPVVQVPDIRPAPATLDFGSLPAGPDTAVVELRNDGAAGTVQGTIAPPLFQLVSNPFPLTLAPGAKAQVAVKALNPGTTGTVTAFLKLTWQPGQGSLDVKLTASWS